MSIYAEIKASLNNARKNKSEAKDIVMIPTVLGNLDLKSKVVDGVKTVTDEDAIAYLKSHVKNLEISIEAKRSIGADLADSAVEMAFVSSFLPVQLDEEGIRNIIRNHSFSNIGEFMGYMKKNHSGQYDGKVASEVFKAGI